MRRRIMATMAAIVVSAGLIVGLVTPAGAGCFSEGSIRARVVEIGTGESPTVYLDIRHVFSNEYTWSVYVYQESNGEPGLQRGTRHAGIPGVSGPDTHDECPDYWYANSDTVIY